GPGSGVCGAIKNIAARADPDWDTGTFRFKKSFLVASNRFFYARRAKNGPQRHFLVNFRHQIYLPPNQTVRKQLLN
ncbi:MAG: hypothetical protein ABIQ90_17360, partial [Polaromonas sp.]